MYYFVFGSFHPALYVWDLSILLHTVVMWFICTVIVSYSTFEYTEIHLSILLFWGNICSFWIWIISNNVTMNIFVHSFCVIDTCFSVGCVYTHTQIYMLYIHIYCIYTFIYNIVYIYYRYTLPYMCKYYTCTYQHCSQQYEGSNGKSLPNWYFFLFYFSHSTEWSVGLRYGLICISQMINKNKTSFPTSIGLLYSLLLVCMFVYFSQTIVRLPVFPMTSRILQELSWIRALT